MRIYLKLLFFIILFLILHFAYDFFPNNFFKIFSGTDESVFSHLKIAFWAYFINSIIEYFYCKKQQKKFSFFSSFIINIILPWFIIIIWYIIPALYGKLNSELYEIIWALFVLILAGIFSINLEKSISIVSLNIYSKIFILILFIISVFFFTFFSFNKPWIDLFDIP